MDIFEHRYYRLSKHFMTLLGQWPYQSTRARRGIIAIRIFVAITGISPMVLGVVKYRNDWSIALDSVNAALFVSACHIKMFGIIWNSEKTLKLLNGIIINWQVWARCREVSILHEYAEQGKKMTIVYTAVIYSTIILYTTQPMIPKIIDAILKNGTELGRFPYPVDYYYFDGKNYYYYIMIHFYISACVVSIPLIASASLLILYVQHVCGIFAALGQKLEQIGNNDTSVENVDLTSFINRHNNAIEFANLIEATYTWNFFFIIGLGMVLVNLLGRQILTRTNEPATIIRFIAFALSLALVFYVDCNISQVLINHSVNIHFNTYNNKWYRLLPRDQKLLQLMTMRCRVPCQLTAGKMLIMSMRSFGLTARTAMSYFAVVRPK